MPGLDEKKIAEQLNSLPGWERDGGQLSRVFKFDAFMEGIEFVREVAAAAEEMDHHPDIDIRYTDVKISLSSHDVGGITDRDFRLASQISEIA